jgi:plastocyanin/glucose/arabinose dehydrogenase
MKNILKQSVQWGLLATLAVGTVQAQKTAALPATEDDFYKMATLPIPEGVVLEVGGMVSLPNGNLAVSTRRGEVWMIENPTSEGNRAPYYRKFASGMHEILGLAHKDGTLLMAQRGELTRLIDRDKDGRADRYETVYAWPISGHYHEYSYGPVLMPDGSMMVTGNVAFGDAEWWLGESRVPWRGWAMRITPDGKMEPWATGMRSPAGIGMYKGEFFYGDNQGDWMGSGFIGHATKGAFFGHPAGLKWADRPESPVTVRTNDIYSRVDPRSNPVGGPYVKPENLPGRGKSLYEVAKEVPGVKTPAVWLPHGILGISTSEIVNIPEDSRFGPFGGQLLVGDQGQSKIARVFLEQVKGQYQGGAIMFREGFKSGVLRMAWAQDGSLFVGQTNRGWGSTGPAPYALQRLIFSGKTPFEIQKVSAMPDGFELEFTQPVDRKTAEDVNSYDITGFVYKYHPVYGSPVVDDKNCAIRGIKVSEDGTRVRLLVDGLREKYIHEIKVPGLRNTEASPLLHTTAYYTLNAIPDGDKLVGFKAVKATAHAGHSMATPATTSPDGPAAATTAATKAGAPAAKLAKRTTTQPASWTSGPDKVVLMGTRPGLKFDQEELTVKAGSKVKLTFSNNDDMPHNFLLVQQGTSNTVGEAAINLGLKGNEMGYVPNLAAVLNHTKLVQPGASDTIFFTAPTRPGTYTYVCTYPGHYLSMKGTLTVVP